VQFLVSKAMLRHLAGDNREERRRRRAVVEDEVCLIEAHS
jgi:hypothetical protein